MGMFSSFTRRVKRTVKKTLNAASNIDPGTKLLTDPKAAGDKVGNILKDPLGNAKEDLASLADATMAPFSKDSKGAPALASTQSVEKKRKAKLAGQRLGGAASAQGSQYSLISGSKGRGSLG